MTQSAKSRKDAKRNRRQAAIAAKQEAKRRQEAERRRRSWAIYGGIAAAVIVVAGVAVWSGGRGRSGIVEVPGASGTPPAQATAPTQAAAPGTPAGGAAATPRGSQSPAGSSPTAGAQLVVETYPDQGTVHIRLGEAHPAYNSNPPTSGWHTPQTAPWGVHRVAIPDQVLVHNLEHGGIWISYKDPTATALVEKLEALVSRYRSKVILTPRPQNDAPIAVAAWTRLMRLQAFDEAAIVKFIEAYKNQGPEKVPD